MRAMALAAAGSRLEAVERPVPVPGPHEVVVRVAACGVCRTDLHVVDRELPGGARRDRAGARDRRARHARGDEVAGLALGQRIGIPWLGHTCGVCRYCRAGRENLCDAPGFTGYTRDGGYADYACADARYCFPLPAGYADAEAAPLLCAGLIGHRALAMAGEAEALGIYGFGAAAHIVVQVARAEGRRVHAFTRPGDRAAQDFARELGAVWAGGSDEAPPEPLDAAILFAPVGALVPAALAATRKGGPWSAAAST